MNQGPVPPFSDGPPKLPSGTLHVVASGENLAQICLLYSIQLEQLYRANGLTNSSLIYPGLKLVIPQAVEVELSLEAPKEHVVQIGESLLAIAERYQLSLDELLAINGLNQNGLVFPGTKLSLVQIEKTVTVPEATLFSRRPPPFCLVHGYHKVKSGDQVSRIAAFHGVSTQALLSANQLGWNSPIHVGQKLIVPISHGPFDCPALVELGPPAENTVHVYFEICQELHYSEYVLVISLSVEMQKSGLNPEFGARTAGVVLLKQISTIVNVETLSIKEIIGELENSSLAEGAALWEPSAWYWLHQVKSK